MKLRTSLFFPLLFCGALAADPGANAVRIFETAPLRFEPVPGDGSAQFIARGPRFRLVFNSNNATLLGADKQVTLKFQGADPGAKLEPLQKLSSTTNLFLGNDRSKWRRDVPNFGRLQVRSLYPGVDLVYYGNAGDLEYDLTVKAGADPGQIRLRLEGGRAHVDRDGNLIAELIQKRPVAYQLAANGAKIPVESRYRKNADGSYGFVLGKYDRGRELVIDPVLSYSYYLSGSYQSIAQGIAIDKNGFLWVAGTTFCVDFPVAGTAFQTANTGGSDVFVAKLTINGPEDHQLIYSTYLGGSSNDTLGGMAVSPDGDVYLTGTTISSDFPMQDAAQTALDGTSDAFVAWVNTSGALAYSTFLGGAMTEVGTAVTYNNKGEIFVTGGTDSTDFPTAGGPLQSANAGQRDAYVAVYNPLLSGTATLLYSTYLGGSGWDIGNAITLAADGSLWVAGGTYSHDFPQRGNSYQPNYHDVGDAFVAHVSTSGGSSGLEYTSYLGGAGLDQATNLLLDAKGRVVVSGYTLSANFPVSTDAMQASYAGNTDAFISILDPTIKNHNAQLVYSTYFGGSAEDVPFDLKQDASGSLYLCGVTFSAGLPTTKNAAQAAYDGTEDAFALKFTPPTAGTAGIDYLTYLGSDGLQVGYGVEFDTKGHLYMVGYTSGPIFRLLHGVAKSSPPGNIDGFVIGLTIE